MISTTKKKSRPRLLRKPSDAIGDSANSSSDDNYRVGPGHPPKEYQFKPGQSGNPRGAKRKTSSIAPDLRALLQRALNDKVKMRRGEREQIITKAAAGIDELVNQFVKGDHRARRDLMALTGKLGIDLTAGQNNAIEHALAEALSAEDQALLDDYVRRHSGRQPHDAENNIVPLLKSENPPKLGLPKPEE